ncbi:hypothetical protein W911_15485 [Hyphomicrobium nitrativorans NL23]|uniref:Uncharacterized protein n=1 Tax=Hyphomicrobium nitrativorans NL23 TaxID=1029756 RepID=V5SK93_9HYPH|nr:hypothetical protein [Hyphomicrobium nitrativorans]AHB50384.1 hypothetical protein W911_15485 [Hyphomicrobium nitrativorans NL23]
MGGSLKRAFAAAALALGLMVHGVSATAAERICEAPMPSGSSVGTTEADARVGAITSWRMKTMKKYGPRHADWGLAAEKVTKCAPRSNGGFECATTARPCTIRDSDGNTEI